MTDFAQARRTMVDCQIRPNDVTEGRVVDAFLAVPRENFVPTARQALTYADADLPVGQPGARRYLMQPMFLAKLIQLAGVKPTDVVLDVGTATGYAAAVFAELAAKVVALRSNSREMPPDLGEQIPYIRRMLEAMRIPMLEYAGFEADDVIGAMARRASAEFDVVIVSSDKDMLQLVNDRVHMFNPVKEDIWYDAAETEEFMGVKPSQVADLLALKGDSIDNIPGAPGIGDKGARDLILRFGSVEGALEHAAEVERKMYRESLQNNREQILLSKKLATIDTDGADRV